MIILTVILALLTLYYIVGRYVRDLLDDATDQSGRYYGVLEGLFYAMTAILFLAYFIVFKAKRRDLVVALRALG